jgi:hypothetical protein
MGLNQYGANLKLILEKTWKVIEEKHEQKLRKREIATVLER